MGFFGCIMFGDGWWVELQYAGGACGGINNVKWREIIRSILQGLNVWDGKNSLGIKLNIRMTTT
jgi:hypothetical protein